jgi:hypothetical protein
MLVGAVLVDGSYAREVDAAVGAGDTGVVEITDVKGGDDVSVLEANPIGTVVSSVELALERVADALLSAVADAAVASEEVVVVGTSLETAEDAEELRSEVAVAVALLVSAPEDKPTVVPLDNGSDVEMPTTAEVVMVALLGKKEATLDACEAEADAERDESTEESDAEIEDAMDDWAEEMDDRRDDGGEVTGTGTMTVPEVEAVKEVIEGETPVAAAVPEIVVSLLTTALSADEAGLAVAEDSRTVLSMAVAVVKLLPGADDTIVLFAGTEMRVPGVVVVNASLVARALETSLLVPVTGTLLVVSDRTGDVAETVPVEAATVAPLSVWEGTVSVVAEVAGALSVAFALSVTEAVVWDEARALVPEAVLSVAVAVGKELVSVTDPGSASVDLSAAPVDVAEASVMVAEGVTSEAEALERRLEKSDASEEEMALSVAVATTLESSESREEAMLDRIPPTSPVVVGPSDDVLVASVVPEEAKEEMSVSRAAWADETMLDKTSGIPVALALTGSGMMGVVELSIEAVSVDKVSVEPPVVVAKRGKGLVEGVETTVVLSASVWSATAVAVLGSLPVVSEAGAAVDVAEEPPLRKVERPTMMPPPVLESDDWEPLTEEGVGRITISGMPPVDATLLVSWVIAVGCTSSAEETATPVDATDDWVTSGEKVGCTSSEDWMVAPVDAATGLTVMVWTPPVVSSLDAIVSLSVVWAEAAEAVGVTDSDTTPPVEAGRWIEASKREDVSAAVGSTDSEMAAPVLPTAVTSVESDERVGVTDSTTTLPVEPRDASVLGAVGVTDSTTLMPVEPTDDEGDALIEVNWAESSDDDSLEVGCTTSVGTPPVEATDEGDVSSTVEAAVGSTLSVVICAVEATEDGAVGWMTTEGRLPVDAIEGEEEAIVGWTISEGISPVEATEEPSDDGTLEVVSSADETDVVCWRTDDGDEEIVGWTTIEGISPVDATEEVASVEVSTDEGDTAVGVTVSLAMLPVDATKVSAFEVGTDEDFVDGWISETTTLSIVDEVCWDVVGSGEAVGKIVVEGDEPVGATKLSAVLEVVAGSSASVEVESLVAAAAASSAGEDDAVEKRPWNSSDEVEEGSWDSEKREENAWAQDDGSEVAVSGSRVEVSGSEVDADDVAEVVFCRAFCLFRGRGK